MNIANIEQFNTILEFIIPLFNNPITLILIICYSILQFLMPFYIIRLSVKCDKLEYKMLMEHADTHDKLNYLINQQKPKN